MKASFFALFPPPPPQKKVDLFFQAWQQTQIYILLNVLRPAKQKRTLHHRVLSPIAQIAD